MNPAPTRNLRSSLAEVVSNIVPDFSDCVSDYRCVDDFQGLWNQTWDLSFASGGEDGDSENGSAELHIVVNSDLPPCLLPAFPILENINFTSHFSALSWAACHLVHLSRLEKVIPCGILIITASDQTSPMAERLKAVFRKSPDDRSALIQNVIYLVNPNLETICQSIRCLQNPPETSIIQGEILTSILGAAMTTERQDHHAIGNVLSAYLLANETLDEKNTWVDAAMPLQEPCVTLCAAISRPKSEQNRIRPWRTGGKPLRVESISCPVLLIDDMADIWAPFLRGALSNAAVSHTPRRDFNSFITDLPDRLKSFAPSQKLTPRLLCGDTTHPETGDFVFPESEDFILFLDLRLLPEGNQRTVFYKALAKTGLRLLEEGLLTPWLITESDQREWKGEMDDIIAGKARPQQLETLPARLLSLLDPSLPIVIFSSTHSSELTEPFRPFGNIITTFRKPVPARLPDLLMSDLKREFTATVGRARKIRQARLLLSRLGKLQTPSPPAASRRYCEIFLDESGRTLDPSMNISGIGVCGNSQAEIKAFHQNLHQTLIHRGLLPGVTRFHAVGGARSAQRPEDYPRKRPEHETEEGWNDHWNQIVALANVAHTLADEHKVSLFAFSHEFASPSGTPEWLDAGGFQDREQRDLLDIRYSVRMVELLESLFFDLLQVGVRNPDEPLHVGIDLASRDALIEAGPLRTADAFDEKLRYRMLDNWSVRCEDEQRWDSRTHQMVDYIVTDRKSIDDRMPLRFVEIAASRRATIPGNRLKIYRARASILLNWNDVTHQTCTSWDPKKNALPYPLHYLADYISNAVKNSKQNSARSFLEITSVKGWFDEGLSITPDDPWRSLLSLWDQGERATALQKLVSLDDAAWAASPAYFRARISAWATSDLSAETLNKLFG
jgi:hypothetical protein